MRVWCTTTTTTVTATRAALLEHTARIVITVYVHQPDGRRDLQHTPTTSAVNYTAKTPTTARSHLRTWLTDGGLSEPMTTLTPSEPEQRARTHNGDDVVVYNSRVNSGHVTAWSGRLDRRNPSFGRVETNFFHVAPFFGGIRRPRTREYANNLQRPQAPIDGRTNERTNAVQTCTPAGGRSMRGPRLCSARSELPHHSGQTNGVVSDISIYTAAVIVREVYQISIDGRSRRKTRVGELVYTWRHRAIVDDRISSVTYRIRSSSRRQQLAKSEVQRRGQAWFIQRITDPLFTVGRVATAWRQ